MIERPIWMKKSLLVWRFDTECAHGVINARWLPMNNFFTFECPFIHKFKIIIAQLQPSTL